MTEAEWITSVNPEEMLAVVRDKGSDRLWRLFAVACLRTIEGQLKHEWSRQALDVAERFADGAATPGELRSARVQAEAAAEHYDYEYWLDEIRVSFGSDKAHKELYDAARDAGSVLACVVDDVNGRSLPESLRLPDVIREVFGNPFRWTMIDPAWLFANDGAVRRMAEDVYARRAFEQLPILADALEDAGCTDEAVLSHLRSAGPHVRGCWAIDLILGVRQPPA
jgi:hypothetical protein